MPKQPSFLARHGLGQPNYLLIALAAAFLLALLPRGAYRAVRNNSNNIDRWLSAEAPAIRDLDWFREQFDGDQFVLVSWDGCTLAETAKLQRVARALASEMSPAGQAPENAERALFTRVATGPDIVGQLMAPPYNLPRETAVERLEGAIVGPAAAGMPSGDPSARTTCLAAYISPWAIENETVRRQAIERIREAVTAEAHVDGASIRMVGPAIDAIAIDDASERTLVVWGLAAVLAGLLIGAWRLRSFTLAAVVTAVGVTSAAASLAIVFYFGVFEVLTLGRVAPMLGRPDALTMAVPLLAYVLSSLAALRMIYYYRDARLNHSPVGAAERAVSDGWPKWVIIALMVAAALGTLCVSELLPARRFGLFAGLGVLASIGVVLSMAPVALHRFPPSERVIAALSGGRDVGTPPTWLNGLFEISGAGRWGTLAVGAAALAAALWGIARLDTGPQLPMLAGARSQLIQDYAWFAEHVGNAVPMEVLLTVPSERLREPDESAEADGQQYRLTLQERMELLREVSHAMELLPHVSAVVSPATAMPAAATLADDGAAVRETLERHGYVRTERYSGTDRPTGRELWRASGRVASATRLPSDVDYANVVHAVEAAVEPVLATYDQRDQLVRALHASGRQLTGAKVTVLFRDAGGAVAPAADTPAARLAALLRRSGVAGDDVSFYNLAPLEAAGAEAQVEQAALALANQDAAALAAIGLRDPAVELLAARGVHVSDLSTPAAIEESIAAPPAEGGGPRPIRAVYTGMPPVATAVNEALVATLRFGALAAIPALALVMMFVARDAVGGLLSIVPILFPTVVVLGAMGWLGATVDLGLLLVIGLALGVALHATVSYLAWFRRGGQAGLFRSEAARMAYSRVAPWLLDGTWIAGVGMLTLAASGIMFAQQASLAIPAIMALTMVGSLMLLPAIAMSPLGRFFGADAEPDDAPATLAPVRIEAPAAAPPRHGRADVAAAAGPAAPHRSRSGITADDRREVAEGPHAALHAKLQRLRQPGDRPSS